MTFFDPSILQQQLPDTIDMKKVCCSSTSCQYRRAHHDRPDQPRGKQEFWVPATHQGPYFCSIECSIYWRSEMKKEITDGHTPVPDP